MPADHPRDPPAQGGSFSHRGGRDAPEPVEPDAEDLHGEVVVQLLTRLRELRTDPSAETIGDFRAYVAVTTYHTRDRCLRLKYPQRWSLKNRLRYLLTHQDGFAAWIGPRGELLTGFAAWRDTSCTPAGAHRLRQMRDDPRAFTREALGGEHAGRMNPADLLAAIFHRVGTAIELDELVSFCGSERC